jgi:hypothetical protein
MSHQNATSLNDDDLMPKGDSNDLSTIQLFNEKFQSLKRGQLPETEDEFLNAHVEKGKDAFLGRPVWAATKLIILRQKMTITS